MGATAAQILGSILVIHLLKDKRFNVRVTAARWGLLRPNGGYGGPCGISIWGVEGSLRGLAAFVLSVLVCLMLFCVLAS